MQMIHMARETNCLTTDASNSAQTTTPPNECTNKVVHCAKILSSQLFAYSTAADQMGLLSLSLDGKVNRNREFSVISPSCQAEPCMDHPQAQLQRSQCPQVSSSQIPTPPAQRQDKCVSPQPPHLSQLQTGSCFPRDHHTRQLDETIVARVPKISCDVPSLPMCEPLTQQQSTGKLIASGDKVTSGDRLVSALEATSHLTDLLVKSSANSGYCSSFGSSSTSFFDDDETPHTCGNDHHSSTQSGPSPPGNDDNIDADGLVDHVVVDALDDDDDSNVNDDTRAPLARGHGDADGDGNGDCTSRVSHETDHQQICKEDRSLDGKCDDDNVTMNQASSLLCRPPIDDNDVDQNANANRECSLRDSSSKCVNPNKTTDDDDSHAYPITIEYGSNELTLMIEENLTAAYLINILLLRFSLEEDISWTLFMKITLDEKCLLFNGHAIELECMVEDFEEVVPLVLKYRSSVGNIKLILRRSSDKLAMYNNLSYYFDLNMIDLGEFGRFRSSSISFTSASTHSNRSNSFDGSNTSIRKPISTSLSNEYQALQRFLLISDTLDLIVSSPAQVIRSTAPGTVESHSAVLDKTQLTLSHVNSMSKEVIDLRSNRYDLFTRSSFWSTSPADETGENCFYLVSPNQSCPTYKIILSNRSSNICWISCLRLARIGMQNMRRYIKTYKASQNAQSIQSIHSRHSSFGSKGSTASLAPSSPPSFHSQQHQHTSYNAKTVSFGRQNNIHGICPSLVSASSTSTTSSTTSSATFSTSCTSSSSRGPWFYEELTREQANKLLSQFLSINGVFLVRQSTRSPGTFVLSLVLNRKILHIIVMSVQIDSHTCYLTLDQGKTQFPDLSQLIQFYQSNNSLLGCKLTHYVSRGCINHSH